MKQTSLVLMLVTILTKIFGLAREKALAHFFGTSAMADLFIVALSIPMLLTNLLTGAISTSYIPVYNEIEQRKGRGRADLFTANVTNSMGIFFFLLSLVAIVFARPLLSLISPGFTGAQMERAVLMTRIFLLSMGTTAVGSIYRAYLQIHNHFVLSVIHPIVMNVLIIFSVAFLSKLGLVPMSLGVLLAFILQFAIFLPFLNKDIFRFVLSSKDPYLKTMIISILPIVLSTSVIEFNFIINKALASLVTSGGISALNYASKLQGFVTGIVISSILTVAYPQMARAIANKDEEGLKKSFSDGLSLMGLLVIPATLGLMAFSDEIVALLFQGGAFSAKDAQMTGGVLFYFALSLPALGFREMVSRIFFASGDVRVPVFNSLLILGLNLGFSIFLSRLLGLAGLGLATSLAMILGGIFLAFSLKKKMKGQLVFFDLLTLGKFLLASIIMVVLSKNAYLFLQGSLGLRLALLVAIALGGLIYLAFLWIFRVPEVKEVLKFIREKRKGKE